MTKNFTLIKHIFLILSLILPLGVLAQTATMSGTLTDESNEGLIGATVLLKGTLIGAASDLDGNYTVTNIKPGTYDVVFSYLGYKSQTVSMTFAPGQNVSKNLVLAEDILMLNETVVVGYGKIQREDLTGTVASVSEKDFNKGSNTTPEQLIVGKIPGVKITTNSGQPGAGSRIRIRGGTSINASNDPLIVIDGVPVDNGDIAGAGNALSLINPDDIESMSVLKDASAAAIYGSRAANGVIIITTKKGLSSYSKLTVELTTKNGIAQLPQQYQAMDASTFRALVDSNGTQTQRNLLGEANTNWQDEIYRLGFTTDNDVTISGGIKNLPYRLGLEYFHQDGILKRSRLDRTGLSLNLSPSVLDDHLKINVNTKFYYTNNFFGNSDAIGSAVAFDPTQPVFSGDTALGGYYEWVQASGNPNTLAPKNPLGLIEQKEDKSNVYRFIGNVALDYRLHFLPDLRANLNVGGDFVRSNGTVFIPPSAASNFFDMGSSTQYKQEKNNKLLEFYLNYQKDVESIKSSFDVVGGYSYQNWLSNKPSFAALNALGDTITPAEIDDKTENTLISFFGRLNYAYNKKYLATATLRYDGSSRFSPDTRWGLFPSVALAWRVSDENFLKDNRVLTYLKLRGGWGITGQQDIFNDYPYIANYDEGFTSAQYQFGDSFYIVLRPDGFDANIKWEETSSSNIGIDFGFWRNRINGALDLYIKKTKDLIAEIPVPAGSNFTNRILTNVGSMENMGVEFTLGYNVIQNDNTLLEIGINGTANKNEITKLNKIQDPDDPGVLVGGISGGVGSTIQIHSVGFPVFDYYAYEQVYDENGKPIEGEYVDQNGDNANTADDLIHYGNPEPNFFGGMFVNLDHKKWNAGFSMRGEFGHQVYNNNNSEKGNFNHVAGTQGYLNNLIQNYFDTEFQTPEIRSNLYIEDASFVRMDNLYLGYDFGKVFNEAIALRISAVVQNVFVVSGYSGIDPEIPGGIDNNVFPRPRTYTVNLNLKF